MNEREGKEERERERSPSLNFNQPLWFCVKKKRDKAFGVYRAGWDGPTRDSQQPELPVQHGVLRQSLLLHRLEEVRVTNQPGIEVFVYCCFLTVAV